MAGRDADAAEEVAIHERAETPSILGGQADEFVEAEGVRVAGDVFCLHGRLHDAEPGAAGVVGRVLAGNVVELGRGLVEGDCIVLG